MRTTPNQPLVDRAAVARSLNDVRWEAQFAQLVAFRQRYGHVKGPFRIHYPALSQWVTAQRRFHRQGRLETARALRLMSLGLDWSGKPPIDEIRLDELRDYRAARGHFWVLPQKALLSSWARDLRRRIAAHTLPTWLRTELTRSAYPFSAEAWLWERRFATLAERVRAGQGFEVGNPSMLGPWMKEQRRLHGERKLAKSRSQRLRALGFPFVKPSEPSLADARWVLKLKLVALSPGLTTDNPLGRWVLEQRRRLREGRLKPDRARALREIRRIAVWKPPQSTLWSRRWDEMFARLERFNRREGHTRVARHHAADPELGLWVQQQRTSRAAGKLDPSRVARLESLGFQWEPYEAKWQAMVARLRTFKKQTGDANISRTHGGDPELGEWLHSVRARRANGELSEKKTAELSALGVTWDRKQLTFDRAFRKLANYAAKNGHCAPLASEPEYGVAYALREKKRTKWLRPEWIKLLDELGFAWDAPSRGNADGHPRQLAQHFADHGHHEVPDRPPYKELFAWVEEQRRLARAHQLPAEVGRSLRQLGFPLDSFEISWERSFARATAFQRAHGHPRVSPETALGRWLEGQRSLQQAGTLSGDRADRLDDLGAH